MRGLTLKPVTEIKRHATEIIAEVNRKRTPVLITEHGRSAAVLLDVETYEAMTKRLEIYEGLARGERAYSEGRLVSQADVGERLRKWTRR